MDHARLGQYSRRLEVAVCSFADAMSGAMSSTEKAEPTKGGAAGSGGLAGIVKVVVNTFLEQKHFRQLHRTLSDQWSGCHSLTAAVRLMEAHGVRISAEEEARLSQLPEERMIDSLVQKMPQQSREQFEHFFLQLSFIASTTTRLRTALEAGFSDAIEDAIDSAENVGVLPYIMKMAVAQAGQEVKTTEDLHQQWIAEMDIRMKPLLQSQANSMSTQKALAQVRQEVDAAQLASRQKSSAVLTGMVVGNERVMLATALVAWQEQAKRGKREEEIRKEYEEQINEAKRKLQRFKDTQLNTVRNVVQRNAAESDLTLVATVVAALKAEAAHLKAERGAQQEMEQVDVQLKQFTMSSASNAAKVMARMGVNNEGALRSMAFLGWVQCLDACKVEKSQSESLRAAEARLEKMMKTQKDGAKSVLQRMAQQTDSGLMGTVLAAWADAIAEAKVSNDMDAQIAAKNSKLADFSNRNKASAGNISLRLAALQSESLQVYIWRMWARETKCERMRRYGREKTDKKKQELMGVKSLFKNFAGELETNLKKGTPRVEASRKRGSSAAPKESEAAA